MMGTARPTVAFVYIISFLFLWSTVIHAGACEKCTTRRCTLNCGSFAGKRSDVSNRGDLGELHNNKPSSGIEWTGRQQCTLDAWFEELSLDWQRHIIQIFQLASTYTDPV